MQNNQKLLVTGLVAFGFAFGAYFALQGPKETNAAPVPALTKQQDREERRQRQLNLNLPKEVPDKLKKVEKGLAGRWDHLGEEVLTAASVDTDGEMLYFDKEILVGRSGDGKPIYAQGAHRAFVMDGPLIREVKRKPMTVTIQPERAPGSGFLFEALRKGGQAGREGASLPGPKSPSSGN